MTDRLTYAILFTERRKNMKKIALFELEEKEGVKIELHNDYLTFYDGDYTKVKYEDIISWNA